ncbi:MAG: hypothetical protein KC431_29670, partial [Myxococcales bacterium]|nr:hypothetical protein [Myxococcales bacterium]
MATAILIGLNHELREQVRRVLAPHDVEILLTKDLAQALHQANLRSQVLLICHETQIPEARKLLALEIERTSILFIGSSGMGRANAAVAVPHSGYLAVPFSDDELVAAIDVLEPELRARPAQRIQETLELEITPLIVDDARARALIDWGLRHWTEEVAWARAHAHAEAHALCLSRIGHFSESDARRLFELFNSDHANGRPRVNRFSPAFVGSTANMMVENLEAFNRWSERLWKVADDQQALAAALTALWRSTELPGAGHSYPTVLLHVRDMQRYSPMMTGLLHGYRRLTGQRIRLSDGPAYLKYAVTVASIRDRFDIPDHAIDQVLSEVARAPEQLGGEMPRSGRFSSRAGAAPSEGGEPPSETPVATPEPSPEEAVELHLDLSLHLPRRCLVRLHGELEWPEQGKRLPDPVLLRAIREGEVSDDRALGRQYFEALFADDALRRRYDAARAQAQDSGACFRLVLHMHGDSNGEGCTIA